MLIPPAPPASLAALPPASPPADPTAQALQQSRQIFGSGIKRRSGIKRSLNLGKQAAKQDQDPLDSANTRRDWYEYLIREATARRQMLIDSGKNVTKIDTNLRSLRNKLANI
jgi:hypothetical protein